MARLLPREGKLFDLFNQHANLAAAAAVELQALLADLSELARAGAARRRRTATLRLAESE